MTGDRATGSGDVPDGATGSRARRRARSTREAVERKADQLRSRYGESAPGSVARRLGAVDVVNRAMLFAAVMLLCFFPFLIVVEALAGRSTVAGLSRHLGLSHQAAHDVAGLFTSSTTTSAAITGTGYVFFVLGGIAAAGALQDLYERAFGLESRGFRDVLRRLAWLGLLIACSWVAAWAGRYVHHAGGPLLVVVTGLVVVTAFWWTTAWLLLAGRVSSRNLLPTAVATGLFWVGMQAVFKFTFSNMVVGNYKKYGDIGVVTALMSWFIAIGVVVVLGAVVGLVWRERELSLTGALRQLTRRRRSTAR